MSLFALEFLDKRSCNTKVYIQYIPCNIPVWGPIAYLSPQPLGILPIYWRYIWCWNIKYLNICNSKRWEKPIVRETSMYSRYRNQSVNAKVYQLVEEGQGNGNDGMEIWNQWMGIMGIMGIHGIDRYQQYSKTVKGKNTIVHNDMIKQLHIP